MKTLVPVCGAIFLITQSGDAQETKKEPGIAAILRGAEEVIAGAGAQDTAAPVESAPGRVLTGEDCVRLALEQNAQVFVSAAKVTAAQARRGQAASALRPQVSARAAVVYMAGIDEDLGLGRWVELFGWDNLQPSKDTESIELDLSQVLYAGGQIRAAVRASEHLAQSEEWQRAVALDTLAFEAKRAFATALLTEALVRVAQDSVETFQHHLDDAQRALDVGLIGDFEVLRAKTELGKRESELIAAQNAERLAKVNLCRLLGIQQTTTLALEAHFAYIPLDASLDELVAQALETRAELRALDDARAAAQANRDRLTGQYKPNVAANAKWAKIVGGGELYPDGLTLSVGAEWEIYAGGRRKGEVAEADAAIEELEYQREDVARLVELDVRQAYIRVEDAIAKIRREKGTVVLGREGRRLAALRFQEGIGTQVETLDADLAVTAAETSLVRAMREYYVAHAALEKALGKAAVDRVTAETAPTPDETP